MLEVILYGILPKIKRKANKLSQKDLRKPYEVDDVEGSCLIFDSVIHREKKPLGISLWVDVILKN